MPYHTEKKKNNPHPKTLKGAIEKFEEMKNKPKSNMKSSGRLSKRQRDLMKTHKEHHTKLHLDFMRFLMTKKNCLYRLGNIIDSIADNFVNLDSYNINRLFYHDEDYRNLLNDNLDLKNKDLVVLLTNYLK